jgi:hypothetical protein
MKDGYPRTAYGVWAGNPTGRPYDAERCAFEVFPSIGVQYQCCRLRGHGRDGLFCKQHAKLSKAKAV